MMLRRGWLGPAVLTAATLAAAWLVLTTTVGSVLSRSMPGLALAWSPHNAEANGNLALQLLDQDPKHVDWSVAAPAARAALARSPANVAAIAMLGTEADTHGRQTQAERLFNDADRLSRREPVVEMYLIEAAVRRGDINTALRHYDAALSTAPATADVMLPVLVNASADAAIARPLAALLARRPVWWADFARRLVETRADPGASFPVLLAALRLDPADPDEQPILSAALSRLIDAGHGSEAYAAYSRAVPGTPAKPAPVRDGGFAGPVRLPPFDWQLRDSGGVSGAVQPLGNGNALFVSTDSGADTEAVSQRLLLRPGRYQISARVGSEDGMGGETSLVVACGPSGQTPLARLRAPAGGAPSTLQTSFAVPASCGSQRLGVLVSPADQPGHPTWITAIAIRVVR